MSLRDKASKVNFSWIPGAGAGAGSRAEEGGSRPKTAPGAMMEFANDRRSELLKENDALRGQAALSTELQAKLDEAVADLRQWDAAKPSRLIDPEQVRASRFANRHADTFKSPDFEALKTEIREAGGNVQPVKVRQVAEEGGLIRFEIIFGHRRIEACRQLGLPVLAVVDNVDDQTLFTEMDRENRARKDLSPWEQGTMYRRALSEGLFPSNRKMAEALGIDLSALGRTLMLADLPQEVVAAFPSPLDLQYRWAKPLHDATKANPEQLKSRARKLSELNPRPAAKAVFEGLTGQGRGVEPFHPPEPIEIELGGKRAARLSFAASGAASVTFEPGHLALGDARDFASLVKRFLEEHGSASPDAAPVPGKARKPARE